MTALDTNVLIYACDKSDRRRQQIAGKPNTVTANILMQITDGKVSRLVGDFDEAGMLRQLGVIQS